MVRSLFDSIIVFRSETSISLQTNLHQTSDLGSHRFSELHGKNVVLSDGGRVALRGRESGHAIVFSAAPIVPEEVFEITIHSVQNHLSGTIAIGITNTEPLPLINGLPINSYYITGIKTR